MGKGGFLMALGNKVKKIESYKNKRKSDKIVSFLTDKNKDVRIEAIKALGEIGDDTSVNNLILLLSDPDPDIRRQAAISMGDTGRDVCKTHLQNRVKLEKDEAVLEAIRDSIMRISEQIKSSDR